MTNQTVRSFHPSRHHKCIYTYANILYWKIASVQFEDKSVNMKQNNEKHKIFDHEKWKISRSLRVGNIKIFEALVWEISQKLCCQKTYILA